MDLLLAKGADIDQTNSHGGTPFPLYVAAQFGHPSAVELLLTKGADIQQSWHGDGITPLHMAAVEGHSSIVQHLLSKGADARAVTKHGQTPADLAASRPPRNLSIAALLESKAFTHL